MSKIITLGFVAVLFISVDSLLARQIVRAEVEPNGLITDAGPHSCDFDDRWESIGQITGTISPQDTDIWCAVDPAIPIQDGAIAYLEITCDQEMSWFDEISYGDPFPVCPNLQNTLPITLDQGGGSTSNHAAWIVDGARYTCFSIRSTTHTGPYSCEVNGVILPVELTSFTAVSQGEEILLKWETLSETNNSGFEIQTKENGTWAEVDFVGGKRTTTEKQNYEYLVADVDYGTHKFRLKQIDFDGKFSFSEEVEIDFVPESGFALSELYPNPFSTSSRLDLHNPVEQMITVKLINHLGQELDLIHSGIVEAAKTINLEIKPSSDLPSGRYLLHVQGEYFSESRSVFLVR